MVIKNNGYGLNLKILNGDGKVAEIMESQIYASYWYSSEVAIFNMRNALKLKQEHNVKEHLIILAIDDISRNLFVRLELGWSLDFDVIMVN